MHDAPTTFTSLSRRQTLGAAFALGLSALPFPRAARAAGPVYVRHSVKTAAGQQMLAKYAQAAKLMTAMPASDPRSWTFQWYTHAVPVRVGGQPATKISEINRVFGNAPSPARALAQASWQTCQAHFSNTADLFLPWHRMYLLAFEDVIRGVLNDASFTLPYWDYTDPNQRALPAQFRMPTDATYGTLFRGNRKKTPDIDINAGDPMDKNLTESPYTLGVMRNPDYSGEFGFCFTLDSNLHGDVHTGVGDTTNMGRIAFAAGDPIFWLHHANIDRIWAGWNKGGGSNPALSGSFPFAGRNGARVDLQTADMLDLADLNYQYDTLPTAPAGAAPVAGGPPAAPQTLATSAGPVVLGDTGAEVRLAPTSQTPFTTTAAGGGATRLYVILDGLRARAQPGVLYEVFLNLPQGASAAMKKVRYIGTVNFFGAPTDEHAEHQPRRTVALDITNRTAAVQASGGEPGGLPRVTILPVEQPASGSQPIIEAVRIIRR